MNQSPLVFRSTLFRALTLLIGILIGLALAASSGIVGAAPVQAGPPLPSTFYVLDMDNPVDSGTLDRTFLNSQCNTVLSVSTTPGEWYAFGTTGGSWRHDYPWGPHMGLVVSLTGNAPWYRPGIYGDLHTTHPDVLSGIQMWDQSSWISEAGGVPSQRGLGWTHPIVIFQATQDTLYFRLPDVDCPDNDDGSPTDPMAYNDRYLDWALMRLYFDTTPPETSHTLAGTLGSNGWYNSDVTVTLTASDPENLPTQPASGVASTTLNGAAYSSPVSISTQGLTTHTYYSIDQEGNVETEHSFDLQIDSVPPVSDLTSHNTGDMLTGQVTLSGTASDATSGLDTVEVSLDGGATWLAATGTDTWTLVWDTTASPDGVYDVQVRAVDVAGNIETPSNITVQVDNTPPTTLIDSPTAAALLRGTVTISGTAADNLSGLDRVEVSTDGGLTWQTAASTDNWSLPWDTTTGPDGTISLLARAVDAAGHTGTPDTVTVLVDNTAPGLSITNPEANDVVSGSVTITGTATDEYGSGIDQIEVSLDGGTTWQTATGTEDWSLPWDTTLYVDGPYTILARGRDLAGNTMPDEALPVIVDNTPPQIIITMPTAGEIVSGVVLISGTTFDATSGIDRVEVSLDGGMTWHLATGTDAWTLDWNTNNLPNNDVTLVARTFDRAGHSAETNVTVSVENVDPPPTEPAPTPGPGIEVHDPAISKSGSPTVATLGETVTWTITVSNPSAEAIENVIIIDPLPEMFDITGVENPLGIYRIEGRTVTFELGTLASGQEVVLTIETVANAAARAGETCNSAHAAGSPVMHAGCVMLMPDALPVTGGGPPPTDGWFSSPFEPESMFLASVVSTLLMGLYGLLRRRVMRW